MLSSREATAVAQQEKSITFSDVIAEVEKRFEIEKNAKNEAYSFILQYGLLDKFKQFSKTFANEDYHKMNVQSIISQN